MTIFKVRSLEQHLTLGFSLLAFIMLMMLFLLLKAYDWTSWNIGVMLLLVGTLLLLFCWQFSQRIVSTLSRALLHVEAVKMEDFNQYARADYQSGVARQLHQTLRSLSEDLQTQKSRYDQHAYLLYQLIDQLNTPIMVFNNKHKLTYANTAFSLLYDEPWQLHRLASPHLLGLEQTEKGWQFKKKHQNWQVSQSQFIDGGEAHLLLVFTNIDSAVRASQLQAWQQIIRVMGHEIRNSLTPVSSLAESLNSRAHDPREKQALALISERCHHLQDFINRYSSLSQPLNLSLQPVSLASFTDKLQVLFPNVQFDFDYKEFDILADQTFFEQVLINLCKNAVEAGSKKIKMTSARWKQCIQIEIIDEGHGVANLDNLFVPLFTTKPEGQGIGLAFCRHIIEQHNGTLNLTNNLASVNNGHGVTVSIQLPLSRT